jgi:flagellar motility protein MotE (MotC chaperone)
LNEDLAVEILDKLKKKSAAEILDMMTAKKARRLSELLTGYQRSTASVDMSEETGVADGPSKKK